jgi:hypothetical protein
MPRCVADIFIVHGFVVNNVVLLCGFKQTKGKRHENSDSFDRTAAGIGSGVCINHLWPVVAGGGGMTKDEELAMDLALEALEKLKRAFFKSASTAEELAQGCDRGYEDYEAEFVEPALKAITAIKQARALDKKAENARELGLYYETYAEELEQPVPRQAGMISIAVPAPVAYLCENAVGHKYFRWKKPTSEFKPIALYATPPAQPAVPDAFGTREGEHPQYIQGWNDCRAEMLKGMKP